MSDPFSDIVNADPEFVELWSEMLDVRAAHPRQVEMRDRYFADIDFGHGRVLEVGCGTGAIAEAVRVLRPSGSLAVFDGDYCSTSVSLEPDDPLAPHLSAYTAANVHDPWFMRTCRGRLHDAGLQPVSALLHGFTDPDYFRPVAERAIDLAVKLGNIDAAGEQDLRDEVRRRCESGQFYGHALYASIVAERPTTTSGQLVA